MPVDLRMSQDDRCSDSGEEERRWGTSEAGGKKDGGVGGVFFYFFLFYLFFLYHIFVVKVQEITWSYGENKTQNPKRTNKGNIQNISLQLGSVPVPGPPTGTKLKQVQQEKPFLNQRTA